MNEINVTVKYLIMFIEWENKALKEGPIWFLKFEASQSYSSNYRFIMAQNLETNKYNSRV